jgi:hypothetical protein
MLNCAIAACKFWVASDVRQVQYARGSNALRRTYRRDTRGLENQQHDKRENSIVPVLVQAPQSDTKHLEYKERSHGMLLVQLHEGWDRDVESSARVG